MGRTFIEHPGGARIYTCSNCETPLTNRAELISTVSATIYRIIHCDTIQSIPTWLFI